MQARTWLGRDRSPSPSKRFCQPAHGLRREGAAKALIRPTAPEISMNYARNSGQIFASRTDIWLTVRFSVFRQVFLFEFPKRFPQYGGEGQQIPKEPGPSLDRGEDCK